MIRSEDFKKSATLRQRILLHRLMGYAKKEKELNQLLIYFSDPNYNNTPEEAPPLIDTCYEELEKLGTKIKKTLEKAVEIGMGDVDIINLNFAEYVEENC